MLTLERALIDGAVFDMDGVITETAGLHERAWKTVFDRVLARRGDPDPFTHADYRTHVDGRARAEGVRAFLVSRAIPADEALVADIASEKNDLFGTLLETDGAVVLAGARELLTALARAGVPAGLFTASRNASRVLASAGLVDVFDARIDGHVAADEGLKSKPAPDLPLAAARRLKIAPERAALFEDAIVGVEAGRSGGFALVVGVGEGADADALTRAGAHVTIPSLASVTLS